MNKNQFFKEIKTLPLVEKMRALRSATQGETPVLTREEAYKQAQTLINRAKRAKDKTRLIPFLLKQVEKSKIRYSQEDLNKMMLKHIRTAEGLERRKVLKLIEFFLLTKRQNQEVVSEQDVAIINSVLKVEDYQDYESQYDGIIHVAYRFKGRLITQAVNAFVEKLLTRNKGNFRFIFTLFDEGYISHKVRRKLEEHAERFIERGYGDAIAHQLSAIGEKELAQRYETQNPENWIQED